MRWIIVLLLGVVLAINALPSDVEDFESDAGDENDGASLYEDEGTDDENEADEAEAEDPAELANEDDAGSDEIEGENDPRPRRCLANHKHICKTRRVCPRQDWLWRRKGKCRNVKNCKCVKCVKVRRLYFKCASWGGNCRYYHKTECSYVRCNKGRHFRKTCSGSWFKKKCHWYWKHFCKG